MPTGITPRARQTLRAARRPCGPPAIFERGSTGTAPDCHGLLRQISHIEDVVRGRWPIKMTRPLARRYAVATLGMQRCRTAARIFMCSARLPSNNLCSVAHSLGAKPPRVRKCNGLRHRAGQGACFRGDGYRRRHARGVRGDVRQPDTRFPGKKSTRSHSGPAARSAVRFGRVPNLCLRL